MITDCHFHLDTHYISLDELMQQMEREGIDRVALMARMNDPLPELPGFLAPLLRALLTRSLLRPAGRMLAANFNRDGNLRTPRGIAVVYPEPDNAPVFAAAEKHPGRLLAWAFVNPRCGSDAAAIVRNYAAHKAFIGVKAHPFWHRYEPALLIPAAKEAARVHKPLLIHAGFGDHGNVRPLLDAVPDLKLILAHAAFPRFAATWKEIKDDPRVYVDLSQTVYVDEKITLNAVEALGPERCLFGTDGPYGSPGRDGSFSFSPIRQRIEKLFPEQQARQMLHDNFVRVCGV